MHKNGIVSLIFLAGIFLAACQPVQPVADSIAGVWMTNVGVLTLAENGDQLVAKMAGYGGQWDFSMTGALAGDTASFTGDLPWGDTMILIFSEDRQSFHSMDMSLAFCGSRSAALPMGCGFSGKWMLKYVMAQDGAYADLIQTGDQVTGMIYSSDGQPMTSLTGTVSWGKGWRAETQTDWGNLTFSMASNEKAFEIRPGSEFCGLREEEETAYVFYFDCQP
jgi:hypothetical protein